MSYICYTLRSLNSEYFNRTYTGITNNSVRRLKQHNGILKGGARSTQKIRPLEYFIKIINLTKSEALSIERRIHHMKKQKRYQGLTGSLLCVMFFVDNRIIEHKNVIFYGFNNKLDM